MTEPYKEPQLTNEIVPNPEAVASASAANHSAAVGGGVAIAGCLGALVAIAAVPLFLLTILGDLMSGGQVPGHGQSEINNASAALGSWIGIGFIGVCVAVVGGIYAIRKRKPKQ